MEWETVQPILYILGSIMAAGFVLFLLVIGFAVRQVRKIDIPEDADFVETLRLAPFSIVLAIDLLDLSLDFFAMPISWAILSRLGLKSLRGVSVIEAGIPGTQFIPLLSVCWIGVRLLRL